jgi:hypothetical protein
MSGESPASVLFSSDGTELAVVSGSAIPTSTRALLISGQNPSGNATYVPSSLHGAFGTAEMSNDFSIQSNATLIASGSTLVTANYFGTHEIALIVNVTVAPTGTTPTLSYSIQEVDPGNGTTLYGSTASTGSITGTGVFTAILNVTTSSMVKVTWTITGTTPSFTGVYATITTKNTPSTQTINGTVTSTNPSVGTDGGASLTSDTQVGGIATTAAPTYTTGTLDALSLTLGGQLRIDGAYPKATTTANSADMMQVGGIVTTAAPAYTTGQINALSLDTAGNLRVSAITNKAATSAVTSVAVTASTNTTLLASNASRIFASIFNGSNKTIYIKLGTTASLTSYTIQLFTGSYWEVPNDYTGNIDEFSPAGASGNVLVTELTP